MTQEKSVKKKKKAAKKKTSSKRVTTKDKNGVVIDQIQNPQLNLEKDPPYLAPPQPLPPKRKRSPKPKKVEGLNDRQLKFCDEYLLCLNLTQAAINAGYSPRSSPQMGEALMKKHEVAEYIKKKMEKREKRVEVKQDRIIEELAKIAFSDMKNVATWGNGSVTFLDSEELSSDVTASISEISSSYGENSSSMKVKLHDKLRALDMLGRHLNLEMSKQKTSLDITGSIRIEKLEELSDAELLAIIEENDEQETEES